MTYVKEDSCLCHLAELKSNIHVGKHVWILIWRYELALDQRPIIVIENLKKRIIVTAPETFYFSTKTWVNGERTLSERWAQAERNLVNATQQC